MWARNASLSTLARPAATAFKGWRGEGFWRWWEIGEGSLYWLQRDVIAQLLQTFDQLPCDLRLVLPVVMRLAEFLIDAPMAKDVEENSQQLMSYRQNGFLLATACANAPE